MAEVAIDTIAPGTESEVASVIARAMLTNPNHVAVWRGQGERQLASQTALVRIILGKTPPEDVLVASSDGDVVGVLRMAKSPGCQMSPAQSLGLLPKLIAALRANTGRAIKWISTWAKHDPEEVHWHLGPVGVLPEYQGQRIGSQLMVRYLERVDADGIGSYLETDKSANLGFYEQFGFQTAGTDEVSGVTNWFMWRPPRQQT